VVRDGPAAFEVEKFLHNRHSFGIVWAMTLAQAKARHAQLTDEIRRHDRAYYVLAQPEVTDREYDQLFGELQELEKQFPELVTTSITDQRWVVVDTETNGLDAPIYVVEIAAQLMEGWRPCGDPFQVYLNHDIHIPPQAVAIHGYTREFLREHGMAPVEAHEAFRRYAKNYPLVAHNLSYDWNRALEPEWMRLGLSPVGQRGFCTMLLSRRVLPEVASFRLDGLKSHFRLNAGQSHKALADVKTVVQLFAEIIKPRLEFAGLTTFQAWASFSRQLPISKCLLRTNPQQRLNGGKTYYLGDQKPENLEQKLEQLGQQSGQQGGLLIESIQNLKAHSDSSKQQRCLEWVRRWLERVFIENQIDDAEKTAFEAALVKRLRKPERASELWLPEVGTERKLVFDKPRTVTILGHRFCFTGKAAFGPRKQCETAVLERGGLCDNRPQPCGQLSGTDYLVIGSLGNPSSKYDEAVRLKDQGEPVLVITEQDWQAAVQETPKVPGFVRPKITTKVRTKSPSKTVTETPRAGISVSIGIGPNGPYSRIERIPLQTPPNQKKL
jgi:DNA polymerase III epsilon subunit-like protein